MGFLMGIFSRARKYVNDNSKQVMIYGLGVLTGVGIYAVFELKDIRRELDFSAESFVRGQESYKKHVEGLENYKETVKFWMNRKGLESLKKMLEDEERVHAPLFREGGDLT